MGATRRSSFYVAVSVNGAVVSLAALRNARAYIFRTDRQSLEHSLLCCAPRFTSRPLIAARCRMHRRSDVWIREGILPFERFVFCAGHPRIQRRKSSVLRVHAAGGREDNEGHQQRPVSHNDSSVQRAARSIAVMQTRCHSFHVRDHLSAMLRKAPFLSPLLTEHFAALERPQANSRFRRTTTPVRQFMLQ